MRTTERRPFLIDTDTGVDDALALVLAFRSREVFVDTITTVSGNVEVEKCTENVRRLLQLLTPDAPPLIAMGASKPLVLPLTTAPEVHGADGLGNTSAAIASIKRRAKRPRNLAVHAILDACARHGKALTIVALGPLTNLARAWKADRTVLRRAGRIVSMGGAFRVPGNTGPVAEFNYFVDPHAAEIVLNGSLPLTVVPLDVTEQCVLHRTDWVDALHRRPSALGRFLARATKDYMRYHEQTEGFSGGYLHDPLALAAAVDPTLVTTMRTAVHVECRSPLTRGMTVADFRLDRMRGIDGVDVAVAVERERFLRMFFERISC